MSQQCTTTSYFADTHWQGQIVFYHTGRRSGVGCTALIVVCIWVQAGHAWLSQHYRWGLGRVFEERGHRHAIILEDDMLFSPDFLTMFEVPHQAPYQHLACKLHLLQCLPES